MTANRETTSMWIRDLFASDVTRDIPPVVYFHEQGPQKLADEVGEYIITGGWPEAHPHHRRVPNGIHEQYVRLLSGIAGELEKPNGIELPPSAWISGFYGSGKSSFAKLLGLALDGRALPDGTPLHEALLRRDTSPDAAELRKAWDRLRGRIDPVAVVFDIGGVARDDEPIHGAILRQAQKRLGYCTEDDHVADFELRLEREGIWPRFEDVARATLGRPWSEARDRPLAAEDFSLLMSALFPEKYVDPMAWYMARAGTSVRGGSAEEATRALADMLRFRAPGRTLFVVVDEVSQYIHQDTQRMLALQSFVSELQQRLKGQAWLLVTGQEKLEEAGDQVILGKMKDRFPSRFRVHLAHTNIRDVVHKRLLQKKPDQEPVLRALYQQHRQDLQLYGFECAHLTEEDFVEVYPMLPGHIDLILQITTALRARSTRAQGDDQAIRGLLQLLGELFRDRALADRPVGALVTLDEVYEVQQTALDSDVQASMARVLGRCADDESGLLVRCAKVVALLELVQETLPTQAELVARCLYDRVDLGNRKDAVEQALEELRRRNLLGYSEKLGYKLQSSAGEEWERERREIGVTPEQRSELVREALKYLLGDPEQPRLQGRPFPWGGWYSDGRAADDVLLRDARDDAAFQVDFRFVPRGEQAPETWIKRSDETRVRDRLVWVCGDAEQVEDVARNLGRAQAMVRKYDPRRESLTPTRKVLLQQEINAAEDLLKTLRTAVEAAFAGGQMYFRGRPIPPREHGAGFKQALLAVATRLLPDLYPHFTPTQVDPKELAQLLDADLTGVSARFLGGDLGILELDAGRYVPSCTGVVPRRVLEQIESGGGIGGGNLLRHFARPPYGYTANVVRACVVGLLRAGKVRLQPEGGSEITAVRDAGFRDVFEKDRAFRQATILPAGEDDVGPQVRARICKFFQDHLGHPMDREDHAIADAVAQLFPAQADRLRSVLARLDRVAPDRSVPPRLDALQRALEACLRQVRQTKPTVRQVKQHLDALRDGVSLLNQYHAELTEEVIDQVRAAAKVRDHHAAQLAEEDGVDAPVRLAAERVRAHLAGERPWREIAALAPDLALVTDTYRALRRKLLTWQESEAEQVRARLKARAGFSRLDADQAHHVLRPIAEAMTNTTPEAIAPTLTDLRDPFRLRLARAEEEANDRLDAVLGALDEHVVKRVALRLQHREIKSEAELVALLDEVRARIEPLLKDGARVRLV
jgi:hypothetical protein